MTTSSLAWSQGAFRTGGTDERTGTWNFSLGLVRQGSEKLSGIGDRSLAIDKDWGFGFNFGYNFTNQWALGLDMNFLSPGYTLSGTTDSNEFQILRHEMDMINGMLTGTFNLLEGPITPYMSLSAGFSYLDSNIRKGPSYCYPDWYWGWVCFADSHDTTEFSYGGGLGLRWDISRDIFMRASYNLMNIDINNSSDPEFDIARLEIGWRY